MCGRLWSQVLERISYGGALIASFDFALSFTFYERMYGRVWKQVLERISRRGASFTLFDFALSLPPYGNTCERV